MMKIGIAVITLILACFGVYQFFAQPHAQDVSLESIKVLSPSPKIVAQSPDLALEDRKYLFIPYWNTSIDESTYGSYDRFIYFGVTADSTGALTEDSGFNSLEDFQNSTKGKEQMLTLRLLDTDINSALLENVDAQKKLIAETLALVKSKNFDGVVLDLEMSVLPLSDVQNNITLFVQRFVQSTHDHDAIFAMTIYGDVYYRGRPYDVKQIGKFVDEIMIMAYDFHKSRGEPGPNFPLTGRSTYGYDFDAMITDFSKDVPIQKLSVVMGMYGYDWTLGPQGKPLKSAKALPLNDIEELVTPDCNLEKCKIVTDTKTKESKITYVDEEGYNHEIWFENEASGKIKERYLLNKGIDRVGYWVYGYF